MSKTAARPRGSLQPPEIIETAAALIRDGGLDAFSMRKLAGTLDVTPMALYLRFASRGELLDAVATHMLGTFTTPRVDGPWVDRVVALAGAVRNHLIASRDVLPLLQSDDQLGEAMLDATEAGLSLMLEIGYSDTDAVAAFRSLFWHAVGAAMASDAIGAGQVDRLGPARSTHPTFESLRPHFTQPDAEAIFDRSTRALAEGLAAAARAPRSSST